MVEKADTNVEYEHQLGKGEARYERQLETVHEQQDAANNRLPFSTFALG